MLQQVHKECLLYHVPQKKSLFVIVSTVVITWAELGNVSRALKLHVHAKEETEPQDISSYQQIAICLENRQQMIKFKKLIPEFHD